MSENDVPLMTHIVCEICRGNGFGGSWWNMEVREGLVSRLNALNGDSGFGAMVSNMASGETDELGLNASFEHFYALRGLLERCGSLLKSLNLRYAFLNRRTIFENMDQECNGKCQED